MGMYVGPATVILPDGTTFAVDAHLQSSAAPGVAIWRGVVKSSDAGALWRIATASKAIAQLPTGREGRFVTAAVEGLAGCELRLIGYGAAPF